MTRNRVLTGKGKMAAVNTRDGAAEVNAILGETATVAVSLKPGDVIKNLQTVAKLLQDVENLNKQLQGQYAVGSAAWHTCESLDDKLHDIYILLGE